MSKKVKKIMKISVAVLMTFALVIGYILPITGVFAEEGYVVTFTANTGHEMAIDGGHLKIDGQFVELRDSNNANIGTSSCTDSQNCKITVTTDTPSKLNFNSANKFTLYMQGHSFDVNHEFTASESIAVQDYEEQNNDPGPGPGGGEPQNFDGKAYVLWSCASGVCIHYFDNIPAFDDGNSTFYRASEVTDDTTSAAFDVDAQYKGWYTKNRFDTWVEAYKAAKGITGDINWSTVDPNEVIGEPIDMRQYEEDAIADGVCNKDTMPREEFEPCVDNYAHSKGVIWTGKLQPLPDEPTDNNAYVSYGDRNFKVVIYNDTYKGVTLGDLSSLHYYPASYTNPFIRQDQFDLSGTSKNNPTVIDSVLLESTVALKTLNYNGYSITNIEALDVPEGAVTITKDNSEWKLTFSSNFYDNVIFKVTDSNNGVEYFKVNRYTIQGNIRYWNNSPTLVADFYFDRTKSYTDFNVTAKIIYKNGTSKIVNMEANYGIDDGLGNVTDAYEVDHEAHLQYFNGGKGLKQSTFKYALSNGETDTISKIFINVEFKGSTASNYAGAFAGSDKGVVAYVGDGD